ncbi:MAG: GNAT family N-acetyltransferase [Limnohabitans sp.]|nr:GNAT family N-acetyltransferase [Limnohabitans sp.]
MIEEELSLKNIDSFIKLVLELWNDCDYEEEYDNYKQIIGLKNQICYLVKDQENYFAFIHITTRNEYVEGAESSPVAYIEGIYVKPNHQGNGVARKLVALAENWAKQKGLTQIASDTDISNIPSIDFHKRLGFIEVERVVCFIKDLY